jgi:hypothetical protein
MGPVLLLDVGVVVLLVRPAARELNLFGLTKGVEMKVDELRAVIRIDPLQAKRQLRAELVQRRLDTHLAFPSNAPLSTHVV